MKNTTLVAIYASLLMSYLSANASNDSLNNSCLIVSDTTLFKKIVLFNNTNKYVKATVTTINYFHTHSYRTATNEVISKKYLMTLFLLPDKAFTKIALDSVDTSYVLANDIPLENLNRRIRQAVDESVVGYTATNALLFNLELIMKSGNSYYRVANASFGQCWEITDRSIDKVSQARPSTINIRQVIFSKAQVDTAYAKKIIDIKNRGGLVFSSGMDNIFANVVFKEISTFSPCIFHFRYTPAIAFDGNFWEDGVMDFYYLPDVGIVGGTFSNYFKAIQFDKTAFKPTGIYYSGLYISKQIDSIVNTFNLKDCSNK